MLRLEDCGKVGAGRIKLDVDEVVGFCEDPLLVERLCNFVPVGQVGATNTICGTDGVFGKVSRI